MSPNKKKNEHVEIKVAKIGVVSAVIVATIGLLGVLLGAIINNWGEIAHKKDSATASSNSHQLQVTINNNSLEERVTRVYDEKDNVVMEISNPPNTTMTVELPTGNYKVKVVSSNLLTQEAMATPDPNAHPIVLEDIKIRSNACVAIINIGSFLSVVSARFQSCP